MRLHRKGVFFAAIAAVTVLAVVIARDRYYNRYVWPAEIQREVLGVMLAPADSLIDYQGYSHWGQGMFQWRYKVAPTSKELKTVCGEQNIEKCAFTKSRDVSKQVSDTVSYENGILIVQEDWT